MRVEQGWEWHSLLRQRQNCVIVSCCALGIWGGGTCWQGAKSPVWGWSVDSEWWGTSSAAKSTSEQRESRLLLSTLRYLSTQSEQTSVSKTNFCAKKSELLTESWLLVSRKGARRTMLGGWLLRESDESYVAEGTESLSASAKVTLRACRRCACSWKGERTT